MILAMNLCPPGRCLVKSSRATSEQVGNYCMWGWELFVVFFPHVSVIEGSEILKED